MNKKLWIIPIAGIIVLGFMFGLNYESLVYHYEVYTLQQINQTAIYYNGQHTGDYDNYSIPTLTTITYIDENSLHLTFNKNGYFQTNYEIPNEFEYSTIINKGDKFISMCTYSKPNDDYTIHIYHLVDFTENSVVFDHYGGNLPENVKCEYPEIIEHSFDIQWDSNPFFQYE